MGIDVGAGIVGDALVQFGKARLGALDRNQRCIRVRLGELHRKQSLTCANFYTEVRGLEGDRLPRRFGDISFVEWADHLRCATH
jgi:hypothetical protein